MVDLPRHFVEIQHHLNKMHKPYAVSLAYLRHPGRVRNVGEQPNDVMLDFSQRASKLAKPASTKLSETGNPTKVADVPVKGLSILFS